LHQQVEQYKQQFAQVMDDVQKFNAMLRDQNIPNIFLPKTGTAAAAAAGSGGDQ